MIKINKLAEPACLSDNKHQWTKDLLNAIDTGKKVSDITYNRYNSKEVKDVLKLECKNKCMYCESVVSHVAHEHIEHFRPKARNKNPELTFEWSNLGLACPKCNMNKGDKFEENLPYVNPYLEDPSDFFIAAANIIYHRPGNRRAELTNRTLDLNRPELIAARNERLISIERLINRHAFETNPTLKQAILEEVYIEIGDDKPYSMCSKSLAEMLIQKD